MALDIAIPTLTWTRFQPRSKRESVNHACLITLVGIVDSCHFSGLFRRSVTRAGGYSDGFPELAEQSTPRFLVSGCGSALRDL